MPSKQAKIISITNQKGGCGKTTTAINLAVALANQGQRVLCIDFDSQANLTMGLGCAYPDDLEDNISRILRSQISGLDPLPNILTSHGVDFIPASIELATLEQQLISTMSRETVLKRFLQQFKDNYDYIIIDCLPSLNVLTVNALVACDEIIIPVQSQYFSLKGLEMLLNTTMEIKAQLNPNLAIAGILFTMFDRRSNHQQAAIDLVKVTYEGTIPFFDTIVPLSVKVSDLQSMGKPIVGDKTNQVGEAYQVFAKEFHSK